MATFKIILLLLLFGGVWAFINVFILNIAGIPGVLVAGKPGIRTKTQFIIGSIVSSLGQSYLNLAYTAFVISWIKIKMDQTTNYKFLLWFIVFLVIVGPIWKSLIRARIEFRDSKSNIGNAQVEGLYITVFLTIIGFFVFKYFPQIMSLLWDWVPYVS